MIDEKLVHKAIEGIPNYDVIKETIKSEQESSSPGSHILCIFDDSREAFQSLDPLFTIGSHHVYITYINFLFIIFLFQYIFYCFRCAVQQ